MDDIITTEGTELSVEESSQARFRKLGLCILSLGAVHFTQIKAGQPVTWPIVAIDAIIVIGFVSADTLDKALQSGALGKLKDRAMGLVGK